MNLVGYESLRAAGWHLEPDEEATAMFQDNQYLFDFYGGYRNVDELYDDMALISDTYPSLTQTWKLTNNGLTPLTWTLSLPPDLTWLEAAPLSGLIPAKEDTAVWLTYTAPLTPTGIYSGFMVLETNAANAPETAVPVQMTVEPVSLLHYRYLPLILRTD